MTNIIFNIAPHILIIWALIKNVLGDITEETLMLYIIFAIYLIVAKNHLLKW